jgi:hypothetical protein
MQAFMRKFGINELARTGKVMLCSASYQKCNRQGFDPAARLIPVRTASENCEVEWFVRKIWSRLAPVHETSEVCRIRPKWMVSVARVWSMNEKPVTPETD